MKQRQSVLRSYFKLLLLISSASLVEAASSCSHTFFRSRPESQDGVLEYALHKYDWYRRINEPCPQGMAFDASVFYMQSTKGHKLARYFLPHGQSSLRIGENNTDDISAPWLGIVTPTDTPFESVVCIKPKRKAVGATFKWYFDGDAYFSQNWCVHPWLQVFVPVIHVEHKLHFKEKVLSSVEGQAPSFANATEAFNNPAWNYGKLNNCKHKKTGVDDVSIKLGANVIQNDCHNFGIYGVIFAPTGTRSKAHYLFEPTIGAGRRHTGLGVGITGFHDLWACGEKSLTFLGDVRYAYFLKGRERRSIDLKNGEWSRYLLVSDVAQLNDNVITALPGINFFTRPVDVTPRGAIDAWFALHYSHCCYNIEVGYDFWWRQKEKLCIRPCPSDIAILDIATGCPPGRTSASTAVISAAMPGTGEPLHDATIVPFTDADFNASSAACPRAMSSKIYAAGSYDFTWFSCYPGMVGLGASYEFAHKKSALSQWGIWATTNVSF